MQPQLEAGILYTLRYFSFFDYPPNFEEIHTFLKKKCAKRRLMKILEKIEGKKIIASRIFESSPLFLYQFLSENSTVNTPHQYTERRYTQSKSKEQTKISRQWHTFKSKQGISKKKLNDFRFRLYIKFLSLFPEIQLVGLSGSLAMINAQEKDDIDLFVITGKNRLFTVRLLALIIAQVLGIRRKRHSLYQKKMNDRPKKSDNSFSQTTSEFKNKVCLNLFFDESDLGISKHKQTEYVAHEVLQMKPLIQKNGMYLRFIDTNKWVFDIFPNAKKDFCGIKADFHGYQRESVTNLRKSIANKIEEILKSFQLYLIKKHQTTEIITDTQMWFFPQDFEEIIRSR